MIEKIGMQFISALKKIGVFLHENKKNKMLLKVLELKNEYFPLESFEFALLEKLQDRYKKK